VDDSYRDRLIPWVNSRGGKIDKSRLPQVFSTKWNQILKRLAICGEGHPDPKAPVNRYQQSPLPPETFPIEGIQPEPRCYAKENRRNRKKDCVPAGLEHRSLLYEHTKLRDTLNPAYGLREGIQYLIH
jgi:hypothetical protein